MVLYGERIYQRTWRQKSIADATRQSASWSRRNEAQDLLDAETFAHQKRAAESALGRPVRESELKVPPQRGPLHTQFPSFPAARACLGLSAIAEFKVHAGDANLLLENAVKLPASAVADLDPMALEQTAGFVVEAVANRLCIDQLYRIDGIAAAESYRLFAAATVDRRFERLRDVILAATTLGDLSFGLLKRHQVRQQLHPQTRRILQSFAPACDRYESATAHCSAEELPVYGVNLAREMIGSLLPVLPLKRVTPQKEFVPDEESMREFMRAMEGESARVPLREPAKNASPDDALSRPLAGIDDRVPPAIDQPGPWRLKPDPETPPPDADDATPHPEAGPSEGHGRLESSEPSASDKAAEDVIRQATSVIAQATDRSEWDDPRVDQVTQALRDNPFSPGVVESQLANQRHKVAAYGSDREGTIHEEVLSRCRDPRALDQVRQGVKPVEKKLRGYRWFGRRREAKMSRLQDRGGLDPSRLYRFATSPLLSRRWHKRNVTDYRGRPVVVLAKDGSSSNTADTTFAGKILTAAFLRIERLARIQVFAADYSSDRQRRLVRWLYNPQKTPGRSSLQAADAVASLPPRGQGGNEDVLSISHIMQEVLSSPSARKQTMIVINLTDGKFNSPIAEYRSMVRTLREDYPLTYSLIILGDTTVEVPEADHIVQIPADELQNPQHIAERIAQHVNLLVRQLRGGARARHA